MSDPTTNPSDIAPSDIAPAAIIATMSSPVIPPPLKFEVGKKYWITYKYSTQCNGQMVHGLVNTLSRECLSVDSQGRGLFGDVYHNGWEYKETKLWVSPASAVLDETANKKGFWDIFFS